jgi:hypothetical protein
MRRTPLHVLSLVVLLGTLMGGIHLATAQETGSPDYAGHPLVGTWFLEVDAGDGDTSCPSQVAFTDDGGYIDVDCEGTVILGTWEPTGETTATMTFTSYDEAGGYRVRGSVEVAADSQAFTAEFTLELIDPASGEGLGQYGPGMGTATRLIAEAPGTPVASILDLFGVIEEAAPIASPAP